VVSSDLSGQLYLTTQVATDHSTQVAACVGIFDPTTASAVAEFQDSYLPDTEFHGQVWYDDWAKMASF
jgi:hypothetical protein